MEVMPTETYCQEGMSKIALQYELEALDLFETRVVMGLQLSRMESEMVLFFPIMHLSPVLPVFPNQELLYAPNPYT